MTRGAFLFRGSALTFTALVAIVLALVGGVYGIVLFGLAPVLIGAVCAWWLKPVSAGQGASIGAVAVLVSGFMLLAFHLEGAVCIAMSLLLVVPIGAVGGWLAWAGQNSRHQSFALLVLIPVSGYALDGNARPPLFEVRSSVEIHASPEQVWKRVVSFPELAEPDEWYFRAGIAYPQRARIEGSGPGAVRYCEFSTGPFVEPIETWDEPRLLRFRVTENPAPMREWSPYGKLEPKHLHGYMISKQGQFRLTELPAGRTLLEGTTWYQHGLWPSQYWRVWSDAVIHRIHLRVLNHIKALAEGDTES